MGEKQVASISLFPALMKKIILLHAETTCDIFFAKECIKCSMYTLCIRAGLNSEKFLDLLLLTLHVSCASLMPVFSMELWSCFSVHMICHLTDLSESGVSWHHRILADCS